MMKRTSHAFHLSRVEMNLRESIPYNMVKTIASSKDQEDHSKEIATLMRNVQQRLALNHITKAMPLRGPHSCQVLTTTALWMENAISHLKHWKGMAHSKC